MNEERDYLPPIRGARHRKWLCTKPENEKRFRHPWVRRILLCELPCGAQLFYIAQDASLASQARAVGKFEYNPGRDIDRYGLNVSCEVVELDGCPAYQKTRELVEAFVLDGRRFDANAVTVDVEKDPVNGNVVVARVCDGDGRCGPIAFNATECIEGGFTDLMVVSESCKFRRCAVVEKADDANHDRNDGSEVAIMGDDIRNDDVKTRHGGIIAFFRRLFGRKGRKA